MYRNRQDQLDSIDSIIRQRIRCDVGGENYFLLFFIKRSREKKSAIYEQDLDV